MTKIERDDIALERDPNTGGHNFIWDEAGDVVFTDSEEHSVMSCLVEQRARWWADTDGTHGSQLHTLRTLTRGTPSLAEAFANESVQPLLNQRRIVSFTPRAQANVQGQRFVLNVNWSVPGNKPHSARVAI
jgi:phage gp46-like protein